MDFLVYLRGKKYKNFSFWRYFWMIFHFNDLIRSDLKGFSFTLRFHSSKNKTNDFRLDLN